MEALSIGGSLLGGIMGSNAAEDAAAAQTAAAEKQLALQKQIYDETSANYKPWLDGGNTANSAYLYELGLGAKPTIGGSAAQITTIPGSGSGANGQTAGQAGGMFPGWQGWAPEAQSYIDRGMDPPSYMRTGTNTGSPERYSVNGQIFDTMEQAQAYASANQTGGTEYQGYQKTPAYDFQLSQGMDALQSTAAARGNLLSGATMQSAQTYGQGLADQGYGTYMNQLAGVSSQGQAAAGNQASAGANYAANAGNALAGIGNAQAAGAIGSANAWSGAMNNVLGSVGYMSGSKSTGSANSPASFGSWNFGAI